MLPRPIFVALAAVLCAAPADAQDPDTAHAGGAPALSTIGGAADQHLRLSELLGRAPARGGSLLRSPSSQTPRGRDGIRVLVPEVEAVWNSAIPFSVNDGPLWAGRGASGRVLAGVAATAGPVRLIVAPEATESRNEAFADLLPVGWTPEDHARYQAPWQAGVHSADLPWRHGGAPLRTLHPGQSSLAVRVGAAEAGAATESQWWGPGVRHAILFSNNAPGFPHLFLRTGRPLRTPLGAAEARWITGGLSPSAYAAEGQRGLRSLSALGVTLQPALAPGLTLGAARVVYSPVRGWRAVPGRFADVLGHWDAGRDSTGRAAEQMLALSARWVSPGDGAEVYVEWARRELPDGFRDLLLQPEHGQGYTLGGQMARPLGIGTLRLQAEHTYLEKSPSFRSRPAGSFYASARVPQGYTERGQVIGAATGPGGSGQWLAADVLGRQGEAGVFAGRIRWANDAYYDSPQALARYRGHDVTLLAGTRLAIALGGARLNAEWTVGKRWNYLFQSYAYDWNQRENTVNVVNHTVRVGLGAAAPR